VTKIALIITAVTLVLFYGMRVGWLFIMADEGDVPPISAIPLPPGAQVTGESESCGSGGSSVTYTVRPHDGQTPDGLAAEMGATPQLAVPGNLWDPRTVWVHAYPASGALKLVADYTSGEWVP